MPETSKPQIEIQDGQIIAWFDGIGDPARLSPHSARVWAKVLCTAADAVEALERDLA